jgi:hypothetical protein
LRVNLTRPALLRWALAPTLATGFLIGEYLLTTTGLVDWAVATGIFTVVSLGLTFAKAGVAWRHLP